jgi:hypothetical protein
MRSSVEGVAFNSPLVRLIIGCAFAAIAALGPAKAVAQQASSQAQPDNAGLDFFQPAANLFQPMYMFRTAPGSTREVTTQELNFRFDHSEVLAPLWTLTFRADLPLLAKNPINASNPSGEYLYGVGDSDFQAAIIHDLDQRWAVGFGARVIAPTGDNALGSGKWQIMPIVGFRYALPEVSAGSYFEPIVRYDESFAGDPSKRNISNLQFGPAFNVGLPDRWFITFYPSQDIRWNFGDRVTGQTGRLFLPFDARVGRKLSDNVALSVEIGVPIIKDYPVYNFKTQVRLNVTY